jgi:NAD+ diphosphatase
MPDRFLPAVTPPEDLQAPAWWFAFRGDLLLVQVRNGSFSVPLLRHPQDLSLRCLRSQYLGVLDGRHCFSAELHPESSPASGTAFDNLRALYPSLGDRLFALAGRAKQIVEWDRNHQFCGRCGSPTTTHETERARVCPRCGLESFPRLAPAIIVLIARGDALLLSRSPHFPEGMYSILAGFVEPGETLEEAVEREVMEEVGLRVKNVRYVASQPWPFPHSLMIGYRAEHAGGELKIDPAEIEDARWCRPADLPKLPPPLSIARRLIDGFLQETTCSS